MAGETYLIDADAIINIYNNFDKKVWKGFIGLLEQGEVKTIVHVFDEVEDNDEKCFEAIKQYKNIMTIDAKYTYTEELKGWIDKVLEFKDNLIRQTGGARRKGPADPWLIAMSKEYGYTVVTDERTTGFKHQRRIPFVCDNFNVPHKNSTEFLKEMGLIGGEKK